MASNALRLVQAGAPDLVRSNQKDRFYSNHLSSLLSEITRSSLPLSLWLHWQRELQLFAELTYYGVTTIFGNQTLGEEYCNAIQVDQRSGRGGHRYRVPGIVQRSSSILLQIVGPYAVEKTIDKLYRKIEERNLPLELSEFQYELLERFVGFTDELFTTASRLHLAIFYLQGAYYHIGKRVAGVRYLMVHYGLDGSSQATPINPYKILGWLICLQLAIKAVLWIWGRVRKWVEFRRTASPGEAGQGGSFVIRRDDRTTYVATPSADITNDSNVVDDATSDSDDTIGEGPPSSFKCPLCLEACRWQTATPCGHIFCWQCVGEWVGERAECPVCRSGTQPQQLVCLQHFNP